MDKLILVFYISSDITPSEHHQLLEQLAEQTKNENILFYVFPCSEEGTQRVECINPKLVTTADYVEAKAALDKCTKALDKCTNLLNDFTSSLNKAEEIKKMFSLVKEESLPDEGGDMSEELS